MKFSVLDQQIRRSIIADLISVIPLYNIKNISENTTFQINWNSFYLKIKSLDMTYYNQVVQILNKIQAELDIFMCIRPEITKKNKGIYVELRKNLSNEQIITLMKLYKYSLEYTKSALPTKINIKPEIL